MATIDITRAHSLSKEEAKKRAEELAKGLEQKLDLKLDAITQQLQWLQRP